ncbi:MAG: YkgJ family cysteine cluster protein [Vulcanimicrobiota bacterium]
MNRALKKRLKRLMEAGPPPIGRETALQQTVDSLYSAHYWRTLQILQAGSLESSSEVATRLARATLEASLEAQQEAYRLYPDVPRQIACRAGCAWCCHEPLQVHILDAISVASGLSFPIDYQLDSRVSYELKRNFEPCPFLGTDHRCTVYERRPLVCRAFHSLDVTRCQQVKESQDSQRQVPMHLRAYSFPGLIQEACLDVFQQLGIDRRPVVLGLAVAALTRDFQAMTTDWLSGGLAFEEVVVLGAE